MVKLFPGIDPYLESSGLWPDFHAEFIGCLRSAILELLPAEYDARLDERLYLVHLDSENGKVVVPDITVEQRFESESPVRTGKDSTASVQTATLPLPLTTEAREVFIKILRRDDRSLVAVLELLSPTNKGSERGVYLQKRDELIASSVHLVEFDFLLEGQRLPMGSSLPPADYYVLISRGDRRPNCDVYAWTIRDKSPSIPIPLGRPDEQIVLDIQQVFTTAYERGRYSRAMDYDSSAGFPISEEDQAWLEAQLGRRVNSADD